MIYVTRYLVPDPDQSPRLFGGYVVAESWDDAQSRTPAGHTVVGRLTALMEE